MIVMEDTVMCCMVRSFDFDSGNEGNNFEWWLRPSRPSPSFQSLLNTPTFSLCSYMITISIQIWKLI